MNGRRGRAETRLYRGQCARCRGGYLSVLMEAKSKNKQIWFRIAIIMAVWLCMSLISAVKLTQIYEDTNFVESVIISFSLGFLALPLSFAHLLLNVGDGIISIAGRPILLVYELAYWIAMLGLQIFFVRTGRKIFLIPFIIIALLSAPYCAYYAFALIGI